MPNPDLPAIPERPKLRLVEPVWIDHLGQRFLHLRDPLQMAGSLVMVPEAVAPLLMFLDGSRTVAEIRSALALRVGLSLADLELRSLIGQLDKALMIENGEYQDARRRALGEFRRAEHRPVSHAGAVYPDSADDLEAAIEAWFAEYPLEEEARPRPTGELVGMLCPHIDYNRGQATYARLWQQARYDLSEIETAIVFGTDHYGGIGRLTLTRQSYATPYGTLPTDIRVVGSLADVLGDLSFKEELHHASEHSIELASVWLHHFFRDSDLTLVPILCGSFHDVISGAANPDDDTRLLASLDVLAEVMRQRRTLLIAAGDLAHVGPAFGDTRPLDALGKANVKREDSASVAAICAGDADQFLGISRAESDRRRLCGLPPIYMMLRLLDGATGVSTGYEQCPADEWNGSVVSIAGALLYR